MPAPIRSAVIGVGYLGRFHAQKYLASEQADLVAVVDADEARAKSVATELGVPAMPLAEALAQVDAVSIVVPTGGHFDAAQAAFEAGCHVLLEKPMTRTLEQARQLCDLAEQCKRVLQIGHLERFNPVTRAMLERGVAPLFIESSRIAPFRERGTDVTVVLDLMLHDLDIILSLVDGEITSLDANGIGVLSDEIDIANARLRFDNGCVANLTASRISAKTERQMRIFQRDCYFGADFGSRSLRIRRKQIDPATGAASIGGEDLSFEGDPLADEIEAFLSAISQGSTPLVTGRDGMRALDVAMRVEAVLNSNQG